MVTITSPPRPPHAPAVNPAPTVPVPRPARARARELVQREVEPRRWSRTNSPGWYRVWAVLTAATLAVLCAVGSAAAIRSAGATSRIQTDTAPALLGSQDLFGSVSEANASATAVVLSGAIGTEDRSRRNLYVEALNRASAQTEELSTLVGEDRVSRDALKQIAVALTTYSGHMEASRRENSLRGTQAETELRTALDLASKDMAGAVDTVTERSQTRFAEERQRGRIITLVAAACAVVALAALLRLQAGTLARSNRIVNLPMAVATVLVVVELLMLGYAGVVRSTALGRAETDGYRAIQATALLQRSAFELQSQLSLDLLSGQTENSDTRRLQLTGSINSNLAALSSIADTDRERAAITELGTRWDRYQKATAPLVEGKGAATPATISEFQSSGLSAFNGFNTTIESVLLDNRSQFTGGVDDAARAMRWLPWLAVIAPLVGIAGVLVGAQRRLGDYK